MPISCAPVVFPLHLKSLFQFFQRSRGFVDHLGNVGQDAVKLSTLPHTTRRIMPVLRNIYPATAGIPPDDVMLKKTYSEVNKVLAKERPTSRDSVRRAIRELEGRKSP